MQHYTTGRAAVTENDPQDHIPVGETYAWQPHQPEGGAPSPLPYDPQAQWNPQPPSDPQAQWNPQPASAPQGQWDPQTPYGQPTPTPYGQPTPYAPGGAPSVAPTDQWYPPGPGTTYTPNIGGLPPGGATPPPNYVAEPSKKKRGKLIAALGTVVVLVAAGTFTVVQLTGSTNDGGAATPEAAVQQFFTSVNKEDALGALDMVLPGERSTFLQPLKDIATQLQRVDVLDKTADLSKIGGIDINVTLTSVKADIVNGGSGGDADIADVTIAGSASVSVAGAKIPIGGLLTDNGVTVPDASAPDTPFDSSTKSKSGGSVLAAVKKDGRWYVSMFYSIAESARRDAKQDVPAAADAVKPAGAATPEKAMDAFLAAATSINVEGIIASLNPNEAEALQRYAPLFLADAKSAINDAKRNFSIKITDASYTVNKIDGTHVGVVPKTLNATITSKNSFGDKQTTTIEVNDGCVTVTVQRAKPQNSCTIDDSQINDTVKNKIPSGGDPAKVTTLIDDIKKAFDDLSVKGITETQVGGKWFISPIGTTFDLTLDVLKALDKTEIQTIIDDIKALNS